jgi:hypothetical protein
MKLTKAAAWCGIRARPFRTLDMNQNGRLARCAPIDSRRVYSCNLSGETKTSTVKLNSVASLSYNHCGVARKVGLAGKMHITRNGFVG